MKNFENFIFYFFFGFGVYLYVWGIITPSPPLDLDYGDSAPRSFGTVYLSDSNFRKEKAENSPSVGSNSAVQHVPILAVLSAV